MKIWVAIAVCLFYICSYVAMWIRIARLAKISPTISNCKPRLAPPIEVAKVVTQMPSPNTVGPHYMKSLRALIKGPLGINERKDVVRYKALQVMGLVDGVGIRCVSLTKAGRTLVTTGILTPVVPTPNYTPESIEISLGGVPIVGEITWESVPF